jgi:hypothetical protein
VHDTISCPPVQNWFDGIFLNLVQLATAATRGMLDISIC